MEISMGYVITVEVNTTQENLIIRDHVGIFVVVNAIQTIGAK